MHIKADFGCVFLINGQFCEKATATRYRVNEPLYLTVLPLNAHLLPYTLKVLNAKALTNEQLCKTYLLPDGKPLLKLLPRYNYVYSLGGESPSQKNGAKAFFEAVKKGNLTAARSALTNELNSSIDDQSLLAFFDEYNDIIETDDGRFFLGSTGGKAVQFRFVMHNNLIDDIIEV